MDLYTASALGLEGVVKCALMKNPTLALQTNEKKWSPLMYACTYCQEHIVELLVSCIPSCVYSVDAQSQTPLIVAAKSGNLNIVKMVAQPELLDCKDERGCSALFYAVYYGHMDIIYYLVKCGADVNVRDYNSQTVLMTAVQNGSENVVALLLALGAKTELVTKDTGLRAIDLAQQLKLLQLIILLSVSSVKNLRTLFCNLRLDNYITIFKENDIELDKFLQLKESDLKLLGISKIGPRRIMTLAIDKFNYMNNLKEQLQYSSPNKTECEENSSDGTQSEKITNLEEAHKMIKQLQGKLKSQSHQFLNWQRKFQFQEEFVAQIIKERNEQLRALSAKLIMFEARLHRKQKEIGTLLAQRELVINKQQQTIRSLQNQLSEAGLKYNEDKCFDTTTDSDSAVILDDDENYLSYRPHSSDGVTVARSISDVIQQPNSCKILNMRRSNGYLRRPEMLETVYSVEEDGDGDNVSSPSKEEANKPPRVYTKERLNKFESNVERLEDDREKNKQPAPPPVTAFNRVMSNHRSVTKPKDVKYKRINKAKSKSLEELRGRLRNWVEKSNRFTFSFDQS